jgi:tetratricopeptide (TPR) repeat protein
VFSRSIERYRLVPGIDSADVWRAVGQRAAVKLGLGRLDEAITDYRAVTAALARLAPVDSVPRSVALANLATALSQLGRYAEAEPLYRQAIALLGDPDGAHAHRIAATMQPWAGTLLFLGRTDEAERVARRAMVTNRRLLGAAALPAIEAQRMLVNILADGDRCPEAIALGDSLVALRRELPNGDPSVGTALMFTGWCRARVGEQARGEAEAREALRIRTSQFPTGHWAIAQAQSALGDVLARGASPRDRAEAGRLLREGYDGLRATLDSSHVRVRQARARLEAFERASQ